LNRFGNVTNADGEKLLSANVQAMMGNIGIVGNFIGLWFAGYGTARWGYRPMYILGMVMMTLMVFLFVFCQSLPMLVVSQTLVNIPWGIFRTSGAPQSLSV
jgi:SP family general alpha glucoside:H+ symporter-like MFS transporter